MQDQPRRGMFLAAARQQHIPREGAFRIAGVVEAAEALMEGVAVRTTKTGLRMDFAQQDVRW
jgi:hypothetical protein